MVTTTILPNTRLIGVPSSGAGEDWFILCHKLDRSLAEFGMELAEESIYLLFDRSPGALANGEGTCLVARPVIGPRRDPPSPYILKDLVRSQVYTHEISRNSLPEVLDDAQSVWEDLQRRGKKVGNGFSICIQRRLRPELALKAQLIFTE